MNGNRLDAVLDPLVAFEEAAAGPVALVREIAGRLVRPEADASEREGRFPREAFEALGKAGLLAMPYPEDVGGAGLPYATYLACLEELAAAQLAVGLGVSVQVLTMFPAVTYGSPSQREAWVPPAAEGRWIGSYCLSEPGAGSDAAALSTRARVDREQLVLSGTKAWVTHAGVSDYLVVFCRTGDEGARGISCVFVPSDASGLTVAPPERKMGMNSSPTAQITFDDVSVPAGNLIGETGDGFRIAMGALDGGRLGIASCAVGLAREATAHALVYARDRKQFGRPIVEHQGVGFLLADMATGVEASRALVRAAAERRDRGVSASIQSAMAKLTATDTAMRVATDAVQVFGGYGYVTEFPVERFMREAKVLQIVEGTNQIQRVVIARALARGT